MFERPQPAAPRPRPPTRKRFAIIVLAVAVSVGLGVAAFIVFAGGDDEVSSQDGVPLSLEVPGAFAADVATAADNTIEGPFAR
jgi:hypothetical protein